VQNTSHERWPSRGATRVQLSYHWTDADGRTTVRGGPRTPLPSDVPPGETVTLVQRLLAPEVPGDYTVTLDLVREQVAWFSDKDPDSSTSWSVEVVSPD
jgi:hypothetical protein